MAQQVARESPAGTEFWAYTPPSYNPNDPTGSPLLIALHGGSGIGDDLDILILNNIQGSQDNFQLMPARLIYQNRWDTSLPFVVISPQLKRDLSVPNYNDQKWPPSLVDEVVEYVKQQYNIDDTRIYVTGISLGGNGTWNYAAHYPGKVAAMVPFSGVTQTEYACLVKDVPTWAFHGDNDALVRPEFTLDMATAINGCLPAGKYRPQVSLIPAQAHEGWNPVLTGESLYDPYRWLLKFQLGNNTNVTPYVTAGGDRKINSSTTSLYITGDYFDADGTIASVEWTQLSGPAAVLEDAGTRRLKASSLVTGNYSFRLRVIDDDGGVSDDVMNLSVVAPGGPEITEILLAEANNTPIRPVVEDDVIDFTSIGTTQIDFVGQGNSETRSIVWSIDSYERLFSKNTNGSFQTELKNNLQFWTPDEGKSYVVCATPYPQTGGNGTPGIQKCFRVSFTGGKFYAKNGSNINNLNAWGDNSNGAGTEPVSFTDDPCTYVIPSGHQVTLNAQTVMHPLSKLIVESGATVIFNNRFTIPSGNPTPPSFENVIGDANSTIRIATERVALKSLSFDNTVILENGGTTIPPAQYGTLILRGSTKTFQNNTAVTVRKRLLVENNAGVMNSGQYSAELIVVGEMDVENPDAFAPLRPLSLTIGGPNASLTTTGDLIRLKSLKITAGYELPVVSSGNPAVLEIVDASGPGTVTIEKDGALVLNGHSLSLQGDAAINPLNETGSISLEDSEVIWNVSTARSSNLYPTRESHTASRIQVNATGGGQIVIRDSLKISDEVRVNSGTIQSNGFLVLTSDDQGHAASVAPVGASGNITGNVNIERFIEPGRKWKYMSFPVSGMRVADLQEFIPVTGGFNGSDTGPGLSNEASLYYYDEQTGGWKPYPAAMSDNQQPLDPGRGYAVFMRNASVAEKVVARGELHIGDFAFDLTPDPDINTADNGWNLIGNPYASSIQWGSPGWNISQVNQMVSVRDNEAGSFQVWDGDTGDEDTFNGVIASGQSFWVRATGANPQLTITEAAKVSTGATFYRTGSEVSSLKVKVVSEEHSDNAYVKFNSDGKHSLDNDRDGVKQRNDHLNFSILTSDGVPVAIKNLSDTLCIHETALSFESASTGAYSFQVEGTAFTKTITQLKLVDHYLDSTAILNEGERYDFTVTAEAASAARDRFALWIETRNIPDPTIAFADGMLTTSSGKTVQWLLNGDEIPGATGAALQPEAEGDYQVRVTKGGCTKTSQKFAFRITSVSPAAGEINVYPNPARDQLNVTGMNTPGAEFSITSITGTVVQRGSLAGSGSDVIATDTLPPGVYLLHLRSAAGLVQFKVVIR